MTSTRKRLCLLHLTSPKIPSKHLSLPAKTKPRLESKDSKQKQRLESKDSNPTKCHKTKVPVTNSSIHAAVTSETPPSTSKNNVHLETEEAFTKFAKLRSKCRSTSITVANNHFNGWFSVKNGCSSIY